MTAASPSARAPRRLRPVTVSMSIDTLAWASWPCMSATPRCCSRLTRASWASRCWANVARSWAAISRLVSTSTRSAGNIDVLDVDAPGLDLVARQVLLDVALGRVLDLVALLDELGGAEGLELVAEVVADRRLQHLVDQVLHGADHAR